MCGLGHCRQGSICEFSSPAVSLLLPVSGDRGMHEDMTHSVDSRPLCLSLFGTFMLLNSMVASDIAETFPSGNEVLFGILLKFH